MTSPGIKDAERVISPEQDSLLYSRYSFYPSFIYSLSVSINYRDPVEVGR